LQVTLYDVLLEQGRISEKDMQKVMAGQVEGVTLPQQGLAQNDVGCLVVSR